MVNTAHADGSFDLVARSSSTMTLNIKKKKRDQPMLVNKTTTFIKGFPITNFTCLIFGGDLGRRGYMIKYLATEVKLQKDGPSSWGVGGVGMRNSYFKDDFRIELGEIHLAHLKIAISDSNDRAMPARIPNCVSQAGVGQAWVLERNA